jgi:excisionase family DNA binding protein
MSTRRSPLGQQAWVSAKDIADFLGTTPKHIRCLSQRGEIPKPLRIGKLFRWRREAVEEWLAAQA